MDGDGGMVEGVEGKGWMSFFYSGAIPCLTPSMPAGLGYPSDNPVRG